MKQIVGKISAELRPELCRYRWEDVRAEDVTVEVAPTFITNAGWANGLGNDNSTLVAGNGYWGLDYGADKWSIHDNAAWQTTKTGQYGDVGSRGFPYFLNSGAPDYKITNGLGAAKDGLWQIDVKIGSNGGGYLQSSGRSSADI